MKKYIILSKYCEEGFEISGHESVLWIFEWENFEQAFENVLKKYDYLGYSWDRELYTAFELKSDTPYYKEFTI